MRNPQGFTLVEIVITLAIMAILFASAGVGLSRLEQSLAGSTSDREILHILSSASRKARHGAQGTAWGVYIPYDAGTRTATSVTVFSGTSYATRTAAYDVRYVINDDSKFSYVDFSGAGVDTGNDQEIVFDPLSGSTADYGSIILDWHNTTRTLSISADGIATRQ